MSEPPTIQEIDQSIKEAWRLPAVLIAGGMRIEGFLRSFRYTKEETPPHGGEFEIVIWKITKES